MPYIKPERREGLCDSGHITPTNAGELNYALTDYFIGYIRMKGLSYQTLNDIMGAIEGAKLELYRRVVAPYEDTKIKENGDVYNTSSRIR